MKNHAVRAWPAFAGMSDSDPDDRIAEEELSFLLNAICDPTGRIIPWDAVYPVVAASALGMDTTSVKSKIHCAARFRGKNAQARALAVLGSGLYRTGPNNIYQTWTPITFPVEYSTPALDRVASIVFRNRYGYHQNGFDLPFRVQMENDDFSTPATEAEIIGLAAPLAPFKMNTFVAGTRYPELHTTEWVVTFDYGERGESGPSPPAYLKLAAAENYDYFNVTDLPIGPTGCIARNIYRTRISTGSWSVAGAGAVNAAYNPLKREFFFCGRVNDNTTTSITSNQEASFIGINDSAMDFSRRVPPPRPFPPRAKYQTIHQDRVVWGNLVDHPWVLGITTDYSRAAVTSGTVTISNTGNGTITVTSNLGTTTVTDYKTKSLETIWKALSAPDWSFSSDFTTSGNGFLLRTAAGVDWTRTYRFREVTAQNIFGVIYWLEAIDDDADAVVVDGCERFPNRVMWSNLTFPEEINPLNTVDVSRHDVYPITGLFRNDYTLGVMTQDAIWALTGSFSVDPETFAPDFSVSRTQSEHGNYCTRPDSYIEAPGGIYFVALDGLRRFQGQSSQLVFRAIKRRLLERILVEPRARDNLCMSYWNGILHIAFAGNEVA